MKHRSYKDCEKAAQQVLLRVGAAGMNGAAQWQQASSGGGGCIRDAEVLDCLRRLPFGENRLRRNVIPENARHVYSQCAGLTIARRTQSHGPTKSKIAAKCPLLVRLLALYCRQAEAKLEAEREAGPRADGTGATRGGTEQQHEADTTRLRFLGGSFAFTSITLNFNYAAKPHVDSSHVDGRARIIALGAFTGGELTVAGMGTVPVRSAWVDFDGRRLHHVEPFEGERYSLVYFAHECALAPEPSPSTRELRRELEAMAMRWPLTPPLTVRRRALRVVAAFALLAVATCAHRREK